MADATLERLPDDDDVLLAREVADMIRVARSTFYTIPYFRRTKVRRCRTGVGWTKRAVRQYLANGGYQGAA